MKNPEAVLFGILVVISARSQAGNCLDADLILQNGHIVTMAASPETATAIAVRDGKILALGGDNALRRCASPGTKIVDLGKRTVIPGLIDVHTHAMEWTKEILRGAINAGYPKVHSVTEIVHQVAQRAAAAKPGQWIEGSGWDDAKLSERRYVTKHAGGVACSYRVKEHSSGTKNPLYL